MGRPPGERAQGTFFATGTKDHKVSYFSLPGADFQKILLRLACPIRQVSFDPKGRNVAVAAEDAVIRLVNVSLCQSINVRGHTDTVRASHSRLVAVQPRRLPQCAC